MSATCAEALLALWTGIRPELPVVLDLRLKLIHISFCCVSGRHRPNASDENLSFRGLDGRDKCLRFNGFQ
eukprot:1347689-Amorphochlora_amoeboformis.AAC.1